VNNIDIVPTTAVSSDPASTVLAGAASPSTPSLLPALSTFPDFGGGGLGLNESVDSWTSLARYMAAPAGEPDIALREVIECERARVSARALTAADVAAGLRTARAADMDVVTASERSTETRSA